MGKIRKTGSWHKLNKLTKAVKVTNFKTSFLFSSLAVGYLATAVGVGFYASTSFTELLNDDRFVQYNIDEVRNNFPFFVIDGKHVPIYDSKESLRMEFLNKEMKRIFKDFILNSKFSGFLKYLIDRNPDNYQAEGIYKDLNTSQKIGINDIQYNQISKNIFFMKFSVNGKEQKIPIPVALSVINTEVFLKKFFEFKTLKAARWKKVVHKDDVWYRHTGYLPYQYFAKDTKGLYEQVEKNFKAFIINEKQEFGETSQPADEIINNLNYQLQVFKGDEPLNDEFIMTKKQTTESNAELMIKQIKDNMIGKNQVLPVDHNTNQSKFSIGFVPKNFDVERFKNDAFQLFTSNSTAFEYLDVYNNYPTLPFSKVYSDKVKDQTNILNYNAIPNLKWNEFLNNAYVNNFVLTDFKSSVNEKQWYDKLKECILEKLYQNSTDLINLIDPNHKDENRFKNIITNEEPRFLKGITSITFYDQYHRESCTLSDEDWLKQPLTFKQNYQWIKNNLSNIKSINYAIGEPGTKWKNGLTDSTGAQYKDIHEYAQIFFNKVEFK